MENNIKCPYCNKKAKLLTGEIVYPFYSKLKNKKFWVCQDCDARVGCHKNTDLPLGVLANEELRNFRKLAHAAFDPVWKNKNKTRKQAYYFLAKKLNISEDICHIGVFDITRCKRTMEVCLCGLI